MPHIKSFQLQGHQVARLTGHVYDAQTDAKGKGKIRFGVKVLTCNPLIWGPFIKLYVREFYIGHIPYLFELEHRVRRPTFEAL